MTAPTPTPTPLWGDAADTQVPGDIVTVAGTVELGDETTGPFTARWRDDWERGTTEYTLTGPRLTGTLTVTFTLPPAWIGPEIHTADLSDAKVTCWTYRTDQIDADPLVDATRSDHLTVNGIVLQSQLSVTEGRLDDPHAINRVNFELRRRDAPTFAAEVDVPDRTRSRTEAIVATVVDHWRHREPHTGLMRLRRVQAHLGTFRDQARYRRAHLGHQIRSARNEIAALDRQIAVADELKRLPIAAASSAALAELTAWTRTSPEPVPTPACDCPQFDRHCRCGHTRADHTGSYWRPGTECQTGEGCETGCLHYRECACRCQWHGHPHRLTPAHRSQCHHCAAASATPESTAPALSPEELE